MRNMGKLLVAVQLCLVLVAGTVLAWRAIAFHRATREVNTQIDGYLAATTRAVAVVDSPLLTDSESLLLCTPGPESVASADTAESVMVIIHGTAANGATTEEPAAEEWRSLAKDIEWGPSKQLWLISVSLAKPVLAEIEGPGVRRCTIRDRRSFAQRTGIRQSPVAALFRGRHLILFAMGPTEPALHARFQRELVNASTLRPRTPFVWDKPGKALWDEAVN